MFNSLEYVYCLQGAGSALMRRVNRFHEIVHSMVQVSNIPITVKIRTGISESKNTAHTLVPKLRDWGVALTTVSLCILLKPRRTLFQVSKCLKKFCFNFSVLF